MQNRSVNSSADVANTLAQLIRKKVEIQLTTVWELFTNCFLYKQRCFISPEKMEKDERSPGKATCCTQGQSPQKMIHQ